MREMSSTRDSLAHNSPWSTRASSRVPLVIGVLQTIYGLWLLLLLLAMVVVLAIKGPSHYPIAKWACLALVLEADTLTYFGLRLRKPWVVPLIVLESAYAMIPCFSEQPETLVAVVVTRTFSALALYQLWFFTRPATRWFFGTDGTMVF